MTQELQEVAKFQGSDTQAGKRADDKRDPKTALELLEQVAKDKKGSFSIRYGKRGQWTVGIGYKMGRGYTFLDAVSNLFAELFPELKEKVEAEKRALEEEKSFLGHA
jgi:hypothetical protein